jgi:hypothetical protein
MTREAWCLPPARGAQHLAYIVAVRDGRPYLIRIWTPSQAKVLFIDEVIDAFRFTD